MGRERCSRCHCHHNIMLPHDSEKGGGGISIFQHRLVMTSGWAMDFYGSFSHIHTLTLTHTKCNTVMR